MLTQDQVHTACQKNAGLSARTAGISIPGIEIPGLSTEAPEQQQTDTANDTFTQTAATDMPDSTAPKDTQNPTAPDMRSYDSELQKYYMDLEDGKIPLKYQAEVLQAIMEKAVYYNPAIHDEPPAEKREESKKEKKHLDAAAVLEERMVDFDLRLLGENATEKELDRLAESDLANGPYDDILAPGEHDEALFKSRKFRAAAAKAREQGKYVQITSNNSPLPGVLRSTLKKQKMITVGITDEKDLLYQDYTYHQVFSTLWQNRDTFVENVLLTDLSALHNNMTEEELADALMHTILRVDADRINRMLCIIKQEMNFSKDMISDKHVRPFSGRVATVVAEYDKLSEKMWRRLMQFKKLKQKEEDV